MTDKISVKEKGVVDAGIRDLRTQKEAVTSIGNDLKAELDALTKALGITVDGESAQGEVPTGLGDSAKTRADAASTELGNLATSWQTWVDGVTVIQEDGADRVESGDTSKPSPEPPKPKAKPVPNYQLK